MSGCGIATGVERRIKKRKVRMSARLTVPTVIAGEGHSSDGRAGVISNMSESGMATKGAPLDSEASGSEGSWDKCEMRKRKAHASRRGMVDRR